jgi:hypothetical protein
MNSTDLDNLVEDYLSRLNAALHGIPASHREQLVAEIRQHLDESRSRLPQQSEAAIRDLLDRVGQPDEIAAEAMAGEEPRRRRRLRLLAAAVVAVVVAAAVAIPLALTTVGSTNRPSDNRGPETTATTSPASRLVTVPDLTGQPAPVAAAHLEEMGFTVNQRSLPSTNVAPGEVIILAPPPGSQVTIGSTITLVVSAGPKGSR